MSTSFGQFAIRGSILDIYSYSSEFPFRIDFFGDEIDTIRTFSIEDQLSRDRRESVEIVPELSLAEGEKLPFLHFLDKRTVVAMKDFTFVNDRIDQIYKEGFSSQSMVEQMEGVTEVEAERIRRAMKKELNLSSALQFQQGCGGAPAHRVWHRRTGCGGAQDRGGCRRGAVPYRASAPVP